MTLDSENAATYRVVVPPIPAGQPRPTWSVMIPTFNCAKYLRETLISVLQQGFPPHLMQIEVIDDCSTKDDPQRVVEEVGGGRVNFYRQPHNVGHVRNFETCLLRARGHLVHQLHGDDLVRDGFYRRMQAVFENHPEVGLAFCRVIFADEEGVWRHLPDPLRSKPGIISDWLAQISVRQLVHTPGVVVRRDVYEKLGGFDRRLAWTEDWEMWVRVAVHFPVWYEPEPLAVYRTHSTSNTARHIRSGENARDICRAIEIIHSELPPEVAKRTYRLAKRVNASQLFDIGVQLWAKDEKRAACRQLAVGLQLSRDPRTVYRLIRTLWKIFSHTVHQRMRWARSRWLMQPLPAGK